MEGGWHDFSIIGPLEELVASIEAALHAFVLPSQPQSVHGSRSSEQEGLTPTAAAVNSGAALSRQLPAGVGQPQTRPCAIASAPLHISSSIIESYGGLQYRLSYVRAAADASAGLGGAV